MRKGGHRYLRCWVLASSPGTTVSREVKQMFNFNFQNFLLQATTLLKCQMQINLNYKSASRMDAQLSRNTKTKLSARANRKRTEDLTLLSQSFSAEAEDPRKSEEKQEGASSDDIYGSIDQLLQ